MLDLHERVGLLGLHDLVQRRLDCLLLAAGLGIRVGFDQLGHQ